jgi:hypothetical protein
VLDCGLLHTFTGDDRAVFVGSVRSVLIPGGHYFWAWPVSVTAC